MNRSAHGFTIVELLIVIVVIAILAALSYVGYTNISQRAENSKTIVAAEAYLKAIAMYKVEHGDIPRISGSDGSCLGQDYLWDFNGSTTGDNQCLSSSLPYYRIKGAINQELVKYTGSLPQPSMQVVGLPGGFWSRGITYYHTGSGGFYRIMIALAGDVQCPVYSGYEPGPRDVRSGGVTCTYVLGPYAPTV